MAESVYVELRDYMDRLPGGYPRRDDGLELQILEKIFSPDEAELVMKLRFFPEPAYVIARRLGITESEAREKMESLAGKGLVLRIWSGGEAFYQASQFVIGLLEYQVDKLDKELARMIRDYESTFTSLIDQGQTRIVPVNAAIDSAAAVADYDKVRDIIRKQHLIAIAPCICRKAANLMEDGCNHPVEACMSFGEIGAQYYLDNSLGRRISVHEALDVIDLAEKEGLVLQVSNNSKEMLFVCCCCSCCCEILRTLRKFPKPAEHVQTSFRANIDQAICTSCETCVERCPMDAVVENDNVMAVDHDRCIGCGLCVSTCGQNAVALYPRENIQAIPSNFFKMTSGIAKERGVGFGKLDWVVGVMSLKLVNRTLSPLYKSHIGELMVNQMAKRGWV